MELVLERNLVRLPEFSVMEVQDELKDLQAQLLHFLEERDCVAVAANQVGLTYRLFAVKTAEDVICMCNPMVVKEEGLHVGLETDPTLPGRQFLVARYNEITVDYQTIFGTNEELKLDVEHGGDIVQQMTQLLDGLGIEDLGLEVFEDFLEASPEEQQEVIEYYLDYLRKHQESLQAEIDQDEDAKRIQDAITFMTKAAAGEIEIEMPERIMPKVGRKERRRLKRRGLLDILVDPRTNRYRDLTKEGRVK